MKKLVDHMPLKLTYQAGFGRWTYHIIIPDSAKIKGKWGHMLVFGKLDDYIIRDMHLAPRKNEDKIISINQTIRQALKKAENDMIEVTLFLREPFDEDIEIDEKLESLK